MDGIRTAAIISGIALVGTAFIALMVLGLTSWLGMMIGGASSLAIVFIAMFALIAIVENRR